MKTSRNTYSLACRASSLLMMLALVWLSVSMPFVYSGLKQMQHIAKMAESPEETANPLSNTTEEKTEQGNGNVSEFLHASQEIDHPYYDNRSMLKYHSCAEYSVFHPELVSPPPEI